jgi:hypothetical protein
LFTAVALVLVVLAIQMAVGAYRSERGLYSDEATHFMNGLLLRDYLYDGLGQKPLAFAREYYGHYPKIAPFMWPPFFHGMLGLFLLPGWAPAPAAIFLLALWAAWIAWRLYAMVSTFAGIAVAVATVGLFLVMPDFVTLTSAIMVDIVVAAFALEAAHWLARFFVSERPRDAAVFGVMTALGCLTKGNGVAIVLMPPIMIGLTAQYRILQRAGLYLAAAVVVVLAVPLLVFAARLEAGIGDFGALSWDLVGYRLFLYSSYLWSQLGTMTLLFAAVGVVVAIGSGGRSASALGRAQARALVAVVVATIVFHMLNPHLISIPRYLTMALAPILGLAGLGVVTACSRVRHATWRWSLELAILGALVASQLATQPAAAAQRPLGYRGIVEFIQQERGIAGRRVLVVGDEKAEGALVVEAAVLALKPAPTIIRGSKLLATDDWMGRDLTMHYLSSDAVLDDLEAMHVDYLVIDSSPDSWALPYWSQVRDFIAAHPDRVELAYAPPVNLQTGPIRSLALYTLTHKSPGPPKSVEPTESITFKRGLW